MSPPHHLGTTHASAALLTSAVTLHLDATVEPAISVFALTTLTDPVTGEEVLGLGMGANTGHMDYVELGWAHADRQARPWRRHGAGKSQRKKKLLCSSQQARLRETESLVKSRWCEGAAEGDDVSAESVPTPVTSQTCPTDGTRRCRSSTALDQPPSFSQSEADLCDRRKSEATHTEARHDARRTACDDDLADNNNNDNDAGSSSSMRSSICSSRSNSYGDLLSTTSTVNTMPTNDEEEDDQHNGAHDRFGGDGSCGKTVSRPYSAQRYLRRQLDLRQGQRLLRRHAHRAHVQSINALTSAVELPSVKCMCFIRTSDSPTTLSYLTASEHVIKLFCVRRAGCSALDCFPEMASVVDATFYGSRYYARLPAAHAILPVREFGPVANSIQSLGVSADGVTFMSVEDLQVFWWHLECGETNKGTCIADFRPASGELSEVEELVTAAAFHPTHGSLFLLSRSSGVLNIGDLRNPPLRQPRQYALTTRIVPEYNPIQHASYNEILCSISAAAFMGDNHVVTRDYVSLKLWDLRQAQSPVSMVPVMRYVGPYLDTLYECDSIFDRFHVAIDAASATVVTGLYDGAVAVWQPLSGAEAGEAGGRGRWCTIASISTRSHSPAPRQPERGRVVWYDAEQVSAEEDRR